MSSAAIITLSDDSPATGLTFSNERGVPSAVAHLKIKHGGSPGADPLTNLSLVMYADNPAGSGNYVAKGVPPLDELQGRAEVVGQDSTATPGQEIQLNNVQAMGTNKVAQLPTLLAGDWILVDVWLSEAASSAAGGTYNILFEVAGDSAATPTEEGVTDVATGILTGKKSSRSFLIQGRVATPTGTPDATVHFSGGNWDIDGVDYSYSTPATANADDVTFNLTDGAAGTLTAGQEYWACITQGIAHAPVVTKGVKAAAGTALKPSPGSGLLLAFVKVPYHATAPVITSAEIVQDLTYFRFLFTYPATGLVGTLHAGIGYSSGFKQRQDQKETHTFANGATTEIWKDAQGVTQYVIGSTDQPSAGAHWLWSVTTSGGNITSAADRRTFIPVTPPSNSPSDFNVGGPMELAGVSESQIAGLTSDLAEMFKHDGTVPLSGDADAGGHEWTNAADPTADDSLDTKQARDVAIAAAVPYPVCDIFVGDNVTATWTLTKTPVVGDVYVVGVLSVAYGGPVVKRGTLGAMVDKFPGPSADADHYTLTGTGLKTLTPGTVLGNSPQEYVKVDYFSVE